MKTSKIVKEAMTIFVATFVLGVALLATSIALSWLEIDILNNKAIGALSLVPFSVSFIYLGKVAGIKRFPQIMRSQIIQETDERLVATKNEVDAKALKITQAAMVFGYMGYTLMIPQDTFEAVGWWLILIMTLISFLAQAIIGVSKKKEEEAQV